MPVYLDFSPVELRYVPLDSPRVRRMVVAWPLSFSSRRHTFVSPARVVMGNGGRSSPGASFTPQRIFCLTDKFFRGISSSTGLSSRFQIALRDFRAFFNVLIPD